MSEEISESFTVSRAANGKTSVTCTLVKDKFTVKWSMGCYESEVSRGVERARAGALKAMDDLTEAVVAEWAA